MRAEHHSQISDAVDELRAFVADGERLSMHPESRLARELETARRAIAAYEAARTNAAEASAGVFVERAQLLSARSGQA